MRSRVRVAVASDELRSSVWEAGHEAVDPGTGADALLLGGPDPWETLRAERMAGNTLGAIVFTPGPPPLDRPLLEPVLLLRRLDQLGDCLEGLSRSVPPSRVRLATGTVDLNQALFHRDDDQTQRLSTLEWRLLAYLAARPGEVVPRDELQLQVWDHRRPVPTRSVDMAISRLRAKIEPDPSDPVSLITSRHVGYRLVVVEEHVEDGLVGRSRELQDIRAALDLGLVVISGPPGIGKSRTAGVAAASMGRPLYVPLSDVDSLDVAVSTLALAARVPVEAGDAGSLLERILGALPPGQVVVWDDADDVAELVDVLQASGRPRQILTRRSASPAATCEVELQPLSTEQTLRLLEMRTGSASGLRGIAEALEGVPLSIELAAARLPLLGPEGLEHALRDPLAVLAGDGRSLHAAIQASWNRLSEAAQALLSQLAWFRSTFTGADATAVSQADTDTWLELVEANLVVRDGQRFRLLHAVRSFAWRDDPEAAERYTQWVIERADPLAEALDRAGGRQAHEELRLLVPDLRAVVARLLELAPTPRVEEQLTLATVALHRELTHHASVGDRSRLLACTLDRLSLPHLRARVLFERAQLLTRLDRPAALADHDEVVSIGSGDLAARADLYGAILMVHLGRTRDSLQRMERRAQRSDTMDRTTRLRVEHHLCKLREVTGAVPIGTHLPRMTSIADELHALGALADAVYVAIDVGEWKRAMAHQDTARHLENVSRWVEELHAPGTLGQLKISTANALGMLGEPDRALALLDQAQVLFATIQPMRIFHIQTIRAAVLFNGERLDEAREAYLENAEWGRRNASPYNVLNAALMLCSLEIEAGRIEDALHWGEESVRLAGDAGVHLRAHAALARAYSLWAARRKPELTEALPTIPWDDLSPIGRLEWISLASVVDPSRRDEARALFQTIEPPRREALDALAQAALDGDLDELDRLWERDHLRFGLDHRILARIWRSIASATS